MTLLSRIVLFPYTLPRRSELQHNPLLEKTETAPFLLTTQAIRYLYSVCNLISLHNRPQSDTSFPRLRIEKVVLHINILPRGLVQLEFELSEHGR